MKYLTIIFVILILNLTSCSPIRAMKEAYDQTLHDNFIEDGIEDFIEDFLDIDVDFSTED